LSRNPKDERAEAVAAVTAVLSPIARIMIRGEFGAGALVRAAKLSYLHAAIEEVVPSGARTNISRLSVITGMTRKEVSALLKYSRNENEVAHTGRPMEQRALRVLQGWARDPRFQTRSGRAAELDINGDQRTFRSLVRAYGGDVTPGSVLRELERLNAVTRSRSGRIRPRIRSKRASRSSQQITEFAGLIRDFASTIIQVVEPKDPPVFFGFRESILASKGQAALFQRTFARRAALLLESAEKWQERQTKSLTRMPNRAKESASQIGIGVYLVDRRTVRGSK